MQKNKQRAEQAIEKTHEASRIDARPRVNFGDDVVYKLDAKRVREEATALLAPEGVLVEGGGEAVVWDPSPDAEYDATLMQIVNTLERPNAVGIAAADQRLRALKEAGVLVPATDAAQSAQAANSLERMLTHQMTAAHFDAMRLLTLSHNDRLAPADVARYVNAASRLMDIYQSACLALQKLKTKGQQRVLVQYVNVAEGGQAVVAGALRRGSRRTRRGT